MFDLLKTRYPRASIVAALKQTTLIARGPKPVAALKAFGLQATLTVPEPNTWIDLISTLDEYRPVKRLRVALQEYGASNQDLLEALNQRGVEVFQVLSTAGRFRKIWGHYNEHSTRLSLGRCLCSSSPTPLK
ncbi:MAG: uroporphyrinogen-III synthase [Nitrospirales bacterium]